MIQMIQMIRVLILNKRLAFIAQATLCLDFNFENVHDIKLQQFL